MVVIETKGDVRLDLPVWELGGQGVFVKEIQAALLDGRAEVAVHSAKDLPSEATPGLTLAAVPERGDPRDALVGSRLADLPAGATVATGSVRRRAQLAWLRPDLSFTGVRGNIGTRMNKVPAGGALVVAAAALDRLGLATQAAEILDPAIMLPQVGQGALGIECRTGDDATTALVAALDHPDSHLAVRAERAFLAQLGSGCSLPVGAHATRHGERLRLEGLLASVDGRVLLRAHRDGPPSAPEQLGAALAADLLDGSGGRAVLGLDGAGPR
jgi:hydroxymethylbilane synthase